MKNFRFFLMLSFSALLLVGCSKDDDGGSATPNAPDGVPTGEIVPVSERNEVLTGFSVVNGQERPGNIEESQKWWRYLGGEVTSTDCPEYNQSIQSDYLAFTPDGEILYKYSLDDAQPYARRDYEWINPDTKTGIILDGFAEVSFSKLNNATGITWYSEQSDGECSITTHESLGEFVFE